MQFKQALLRGLLLSVISFSANAALIDHGSYVSDLDSGLDWLKLTATVNRTYDDISANLGTGQEFEGWQYATRTQFADLLWDNGIYESGYPPRPNKEKNPPIKNFNYLLSGNSFTVKDFILLFGNIDPYPNPRDGTRSVGLLADVAGGNFGYAKLYSYYGSPVEDNKLSYGVGVPSSGPTMQTLMSAYGSYLVRPTVTPIPTTAWLFGSGLLGLLSIARRSRKTSNHPAIH